MKKLIKNTGIGLLQVLIMVGMVTSIATYLLKSSSIASKAVRASFYRQELYTYNERLKDYLSDSGMCNDLFSNSLIGTNYLKLSHEKIGSILEVFGVDGKENLIGSNRAFKLTKAFLTDENTGFVKLKYAVTLADEFKNSVYIPDEIFNEVHLFATFKETNGAIKDCYHDPFDPNYEDDYPDGVISQSIRKLCHTIQVDPQDETEYTVKRNENEMPGAYLDPVTMDCFIPGFDEKTFKNKPGKSEVAGKLNFKEATTGEHKGKVLVELEYVDNKCHLPSKGQCPTGTFLVGINSDCSLNCKYLTGNDVAHIVEHKAPGEETGDTDWKNCFGKGSSLSLNNGTTFGTACDQDLPPNFNGDF